MIERDVIEAVRPVADALDRLGVPYQIGGSVASSAYGVARATLDVDLVADLGPEHIGPLVEQLQADYYIDAGMIADAIARQSSFNLVHLSTMIKIDCFIPKQQPFDLAAFGRARLNTLVGEIDATGDRQFYLASPEDVVLRKLEWYKSGGGVSEQQWLDVLGVLKVQAAALDRDYLKEWAAHLGVNELLEQAMCDAELEG